MLVSLYSTEHIGYNSTADNKLNQLIYEME